jgi:hypothetical protein
MVEETAPHAASDDPVAFLRTVSRAQVRQFVNARGLGRWRGYADERAPLVVEFENAGSLDGWRGAATSPDHASAPPPRISR